MLLDLGDIMHRRDKEKILRDIKTCLSSCFRETDPKGWYKDNAFIGIVFTEIKTIDATVKAALSRKVTEHLGRSLDKESLKRIRIFFHVYPEGNDTDIAIHNGFNNVFCSEPSTKKPSGILYASLKRLLDIAGSAFALIIFAPLFPGHRLGCQTYFRWTGAVQAAKAWALRQAVYVSQVQINVQKQRQRSAQGFHHRFHFV